MFNKKISISNKNFNRRAGVIGVKEGMTSVWDEATSLYVPVTLVTIDNKVFDHKTKEKDGYNSLVISYGKSRKINKPMAGILKLIKTDDKNAESETKGSEEHEHAKSWNEIKNTKISHSRLKEFRTDLVNLNIGDSLHASFFKKGQKIDVSGITLGKGFAGGMKRHNFRGLEASHGVSISHRSSGSTGQRQDPGRTFKGKKMPGHMGHKRRTIMNLEVIGHYMNDPRVLLIKGSIPGHKGSFVEIRDAVKY